MAAPPYDINKPNSANPYGADLDQVRDNILSAVMYAASNGGRLPGWDSAFTYVSTDLTETVLTNKTFPTIKIRITYSYSGGNLNKESYYFDKGLGAGYELLSNGVLTYGYTSGDLTSITAGNT